MDVNRCTHKDWIAVINDIFVMEKVAFAQRLKQDKFTRCWTSWKKHVTTVTSDFTWS